MSTEPLKLGVLYSLDVMRRNVEDSPKQERIRNLSVKPLRLIQRQPSDFRSYPPQYIFAHGQRYDGSIDR